MSNAARRDAPPGNYVTHHVSRGLLACPFETQSGPRLGSGVGTFFEEVRARSDLINGANERQRVSLASGRGVGPRERQGEFEGRKRLDKPGERSGALGPRERAGRGVRGAKAPR